MGGKMGWKDKIKKGVSQIKQARDKYQRDKPKREKAALARLIHKSKIESVRAEIRKSQSRNKSPSGGVVNHIMLNQNLEQLGENQ